MTRRKFIKGTTATAATATVAGSQAKSARAGQAKAKGRSNKQKVIADKAPKPAGPYSQAIVSGNTIYIAGQGPFDPRTGKMPEAFEEQVALTLENIKAVVEAAGATMNDVVKVNVFLADLNNFAKMNEVYKRYFADPYPVRATVGVQLLGGMGIEIECVAVKSS